MKPAKAFSTVAKLLKRQADYLAVRPAELLLYLTYSCTSRCKTCNAWRRESARELSLEQWKDFIVSCAGYNIGHVEIFGGDVFLRKELTIPLIRHIKKTLPGVSVGLPTNCNLIDEQLAEDLVSTGIDTLYISVDGAGALHDYIRGVEGSFERVSRGARYIIAAKRKHGLKAPKTIINCTLSRLNCEAFEEVIAFAGEIKADEVHLEYVGAFPQESLESSRIGSLEPDPFYIRSKDMDLFLDKAQARKLKRRIADIRTQRKYPIRIVSQNIDIQNDADMARGSSGNKRCYICRSLIAVDPSGNVVACPFFHSYKLGNVSREAISSIWKNKLHNIFLDKAGKGSLPMCEYCILGVERNPGFFKSLLKSALRYSRK